jgi:hypothetical protein
MVLPIYMHVQKVNGYVYCFFFLTITIIKFEKLINSNISYIHIHFKMSYEEGKIHYLVN